MSRRRVELASRAAVIAAVFVPHGVAELRGAAILVLLGWGVVDLVSMVSGVHGLVGNWIVGSIDWTGPLTATWPPTFAERVARVTAEQWAAVGDAFAQAGDDIRRAMAQLAAYLPRRPS